MGSALDGIRIIDLSRVLGGPYCTQLLGDHGADVIKIEPPMGDETRGWGPPFINGTASYFQGVNRNKRGLALDLAREEGREILLQLLEDADVLVENFKTGTLEKWGIGYDRLHQLFPRLIHCRISGFGADGPLGGLPGYDAIAQAMGGLMSVNGEESGDPLRVGLPLVDMVTGLNAVAGITLALHERTRSGEGQFVEAALFDSALALMHPHFPNVFGGGSEPRRTGNAHPNISPYEAYATGTQKIFLAVGNNTQFAKMCAVLECPQILEDARFQDNSQRVINRAELRGELETVLSRYNGSEIAERLIRAGVPCGPVLNASEVLSHPHTAHRGMLVEIGSYKGTGTPVKLNRTPASYRNAPPAFAQDSNEILAGLGFDESRIRELRESGVAPPAFDSGYHQDDCADCKETIKPGPLGVSQ
ncbi:carnitine dehydratase [Marinobacter fuscus]|uniref:Carnitine dehydratase n=1 Tax=Marinobacter fuscus TaxID=2109942 RepID=A0A2T1KP73_9GAMM|nr:CaiB/BaiF CoA-transferase family protein [Marinobacter fuscus]PSF11951.1 carnitine dehydratase [Marinobacter fuscus]